MRPITLANDALSLEFSPDTGALTGLTAVATGWKVLDRPHLGLSFKLIVPKGRRRNNPVDGERQALTSHAVAADGRSVRFVWDGVDSLHAGHLAIRVEMEVRLEAAKPHHPYTIFVPRGGGAPGLAIANYQYDQPVALKLEIPGQDLAGYRFRLIDDPAWKSVASGLTLPPRSAAVLVPGN